MVEAHVVSEFEIGNTQIKIADNICRQKTACDVELLLCRIAKRARRYFSVPTSTGSNEPKDDKKISANRGDDGGDDSLFGVGGSLDKRGGREAGGHTAAGRGTGDSFAGPASGKPRAAAGHAGGDTRAEERGS